MGPLNGPPTGPVGEQHAAASTGAPARPDVQAIRETASSVAHGLNNLLGAVADLSARLVGANADGRSTTPTQELRLIHQAALDGLELSRRLLALSRGQDLTQRAAAFQARGLDLVDVARAVLDAVELTRPVWHDRLLLDGRHVEPLVEVEQPLLVRGVAGDLREILVNLIHNALDAMPHGGRLCLRGARNGQAVIVTCQDTGHGMDTATLGRVFEPFFTTKGERGTGLGLPIVRNVVRQYGGDATVTSEIGFGTTVTLRLPAAEPLHQSDQVLHQPHVGPGSGAAPLPRTALARPTPSVPRPGDEVGSGVGVSSAPPAGVAIGTRVASGHAVTWGGPARPAAPAGPAPASTGRAIAAEAAARAARTATADDLAASLALRTVLVVEDDPVFRAVFSRRFSLDARRVEAVGDAASALAALESGRWDVLCVDDGLPDRPGRELAAEIRRRRLACAVILVTGTATAPDDPSLAAPGVDAVLPKPCTDAELARAIRVACARQAERSSTPA